MNATNLAGILRRLAPLALSGVLAACGDDPVGIVPLVPDAGGGPALGTGPAITKQPSSASVVAGATATFDVVATGTGPLSYQWLRGGAPIAGATTATLTLPSVAGADDKAQLSVVVSNAVGDVTSANAVLTVTTSIAGPPGWPVLCTGPNSTGWCWVSPASGVKVAFADASNGVLTNGHLIFRTTDGGARWFLATVNDASVVAIEDVHFASPTTAVAVGQTRTSQAVTLRTTDGGATWNTVASGVSSTLLGVSFGSAKIGAAVGAAGAITYTTDGGQTWSPATTSAVALLRSVAFASDTVGVAVGGLGTILRTTDGGVTWATVPSTGDELEDVKFTSPTTGFIVSGDGIKRSDDAGATWAPVSTATGLHALDFGDAMHGIAVGPSSNSVQTSDGGATWTKLVGALSNLHAVAYAGKSTVIVLGQAIQRSTDGGKTWGKTSPVVEVTPPPINGLRYADAATAVAVGGDSLSGSLIMRTTDGGGSWTGIQSPTNSGLVAVDFATPSVGVAVGAGVILRTVNGGAAWTVVNDDPSRRLFAVRFASPTVGLALGRQGLLLRTTDAGASWSPITWSSQVAALSAIAFGSATLGVVGDDSGALFRTTDAGLTWAPVGSAGTATLTSIDFADASTVIAVGGYGVIARSPDGGATWTTLVPMDLNATDLTAVRFASPTLGYIVGSAGLMKRTTDGGKTWTEPFPRLLAPFTALDFSGPKDGLLGGALSNIVRTTTGGQ